MAVLPARALVAALLASLLLAGCATVARGPTTLHGIRCATPPAPVASGGSIAISRGARSHGPVRIGVQFNRNGDIPLSIDLDDLESALVADLVRLLHGFAVDPAAEGDRLEVRVLEVATRSGSAGFFELTAPVRSEIVASARVVRSGGAGPEGAAPAAWSFRGRGEKRVAYIATEDHAESLTKAYCGLLGEFAARAQELSAAVGSRP